MGACEPGTKNRNEKQKRQNQQHGKVLCRTRIRKRKDATRNLSSTTVEILRLSGRGRGRGRGRTPNTMPVCPPLAVPRHKNKPRHPNVSTVNGRATRLSALCMHGLSAAATSACDTCQAEHSQRPVCSSDAEGKSGEMAAGVQGIQGQSMCASSSPPLTLLYHNSGTVRRSQPTGIPRHWHRTTTTTTPCVPRTTPPLHATLTAPPFHVRRSVLVIVFDACTGGDFLSVSARFRRREVHISIASSLFSQFSLSFEFAPRAPCPIPCCV